MRVAIWFLAVFSVVYLTLSSLLELRILILIGRAWTQCPRGKVSSRHQEQVSGGKHSSTVSKTSNRYKYRQSSSWNIQYWSPELT